MTCTSADKRIIKFRAENLGIAILIHIHGYIRDLTAPEPNFEFKIRVHTKDTKGDERVDTNTEFGTVTIVNRNTISFRYPGPAFRPEDPEDLYCVWVEIEYYDQNLSQTVDIYAFDVSQCILIYSDCNCNPI